MLGEALAQPLRQGHLLLDAAGDAAGFAGRQGLRCEVVDAGHEAVVYQVAEELYVVSVRFFSSSSCTLQLRKRVHPRKSASRESVSFRRDRGMI